jgi:hypothetical protein
MKTKTINQLELFPVSIKPLSSHPHLDRVLSRGLVSCNCKSGYINKGSEPCPNCHKEETNEN